ncbi:MAG: CapA family protein [Waddliaceae bacterium]
MEIPRIKENSIIIGLTGDVMMGRLVDEALSKRDPSYVWGDTLHVLRQTDLNLINLETTLTLSEEEVPKVFNFKAKPERVEALTLASVDVANLANNHILDYSYEGLIETLSVLDRAGIDHIGAGLNIEEAKKPLIVDILGVKVGIVGCTDNEPTWKAQEQAPGVHFVEINEKGREDIARQARKLRDQVDCLILTIHWGPNMRERPPEHFRSFARELIEEGVDIFHGHSAHIFQGVEVYGDGVIFYDTGDFVDDYWVDPVLANDRSFLFLVEAAKEGIVGIRLIPTVIDNCQVSFAKGREKKVAMNRMIQLSKEMNTALIADEEGLAWKKK